jgi:hypothetical protein
VSISIYLILAIAILHFLPLEAELFQIIHYVFLTRISFILLFTTIRMHVNYISNLESITCTKEEISPTDTPINILVYSF